MKCPHCNTSFHDFPEVHSITRDAEGNWAVEKVVCPEPHCGKMTLLLVEGDFGRHPSSGWYVADRRREKMIYPRTSNRPPVPSAVPKEFAEDYIEACLVLAESAKASAALSRRCLQHIIREKAGIKRGDLASEIQQVINSRSLPSHLSESIDAIRNIGNFAAHPIKSTSSGEVVPVEPGEAEWNLDVVEALFDFYFVQPDLLQKKRAALDTKLKDAGKPAMKK